MLKIGDKRLALRLATSWSGYSSDRGLSNLTAATGASRRKQSKSMQTVVVPSSLHISRLGWVTCLTPVGQSSILSSTVRQLSISAVVAAEAQEATIKDPPADAATAVDATAAGEPAAAASEATAAAEPAAASASPTELFVLPDKPVPSGSGLTVEYGVGVDPPLEAVGLGSWWPAGRVQVFLDYLHGSLDVHWCGSIVLATVCMRLLIFPLVVMAQKNMVLLHNNNHEMTRLQDKMSVARQRGDVLETTRAGAEMQQFMTDKGINPLKNVIPIMGQMPIFMSMFFGLRGLANLPMESMESGGLGWFTDLTIPDPYYGLPLLLCSSTFLQIKMGADGIGTASNRSPLVNYIMMGIPVILFPATMNFAAAVTFYWTVNNFISLLQARVVRMPFCRKKLGIPELVMKVKITKAKSAGFKQTVKDSISNYRAMADIIDRREYDERVFREIGSSKPKRTFKFDPTKSRLKK